MNSTVIEERPRHTPARKRWLKFFSNKLTKSWIEASRRFGILLLYQVVGWIIFTRVEDGYWFTKCFTDSDSILLKLQKEKNHTHKLLNLYQQLNETFAGNLTLDQFNQTFNNFLQFFQVKQFSVSMDVTKADIFGYCTRWVQFSAVSLTTIGYGNIVPKTDFGKLLVIVYTFIGIPVAVYFFTYMGRVMSSITMSLVNKFCPTQQQGKQRSKEVKIFLALCLLFILFIFFNILMETVVMERLSVVDALYFSWVTMTTIGYGDILPESSSSFLSIMPYIELAIVSSVVDSFLTMVLKTNGVFKAIKQIFSPGSRASVNLERLRSRELPIIYNPPSCISTSEA